MKKLVFLALITLISVGALSAQGWGFIPPSPQTLTIEGTLQLRNGEIAVASGTAFYFVPALARYIGFIDGLREGSQITIEGYSCPRGFFHPNKFTVGGREYDLLGDSQGFAHCPCWGAGFAPRGCHHRGSWGGGPRGRW